MNVLLFEDGRIDQLFPITTGRAGLAISCGGMRLVDLLAEYDIRARAVRNSPSSGFSQYTTWASIEYPAVAQRHA
jgi:hypothetical protein